FRHLHPCPSLFPYTSLFRSAEEAVDGKGEDLAAAARRFAPEGFDAVLAFAGGDELRKLAGVIRRGGRLVHPNGIEPAPRKRRGRSEEHTSELQSRSDLVCRL